MFLDAISYTVFKILGVFFILGTAIFTFLKVGILGNDKDVEYSKDHEERRSLEKDHGVLVDKSRLDVHNVEKMICVTVIISKVISFYMQAKHLDPDWGTLHIILSLLYLKNPIT